MDGSTGKKAEEQGECEGRAVHSWVIGRKRQAFALKGEAPAIHMLARASE